MVFRTTSLRLAHDLSEPEACVPEDDEQGRAAESTLFELNARVAFSEVGEVDAI